MFPRGSSLLLVIVVSVVAGYEPEMRIIDAEKDLEELDVGEVDDPEEEMYNDVSYAFREELRRREKGVGGAKEKKKTSIDPHDYLAQATDGQMQMTFVTLKLSWSLEHRKLGTDKLAADWKTRLTLGGLSKVNVYSFDPGRILMVATDQSEVNDIKHFVLEQPETDFLEYQQKQ
ncbi:hypothetical protein FOZ63_001748, partial [Perkinsus olseni]